MLVMGGRSERANAGHQIHQGAQPHVLSAASGAERRAPVCPSLSVRAGGHMDVAVGWVCSEALTHLFHPETTDEGLLGLLHVL